MLFSSVGQCSNVRLLRNNHMTLTGEGFVDMVDRESARKCIDSLHGREIYGSTLQIEPVQVKYRLR